MKYSTLFVLLFSLGLSAQTNYTSYFTGNSIDIVTQPMGGMCMMGGATEDDNAMIWFLQQANGGDILVLRASGSDGYNDYLYSDLGVPVNSVETIVFSNASASSESYVHERIRQAEAIWFAGGDQWDYISYWQNTPVDSLINIALDQRNIVIGGTSAGMAILGGHRFTAQNGTVTSDAALSDPYNTDVQIGSDAFLDLPIMSDVITDSHYDDPDRKGRHFTFLARILTDQGVEAKGIACNEYTAVCVGEDGIAHVYGGYPTYDEFAYFLRVDCNNPTVPQQCEPSIPLTWNLNGLAVKAFKAPGVPTGATTFDLNTWQEGSGGSWEDWTAVSGILNSTPTAPISCAVGSSELGDDHITLYNTYAGVVLKGIDDRSYIEMTDVSGRKVPFTYRLQMDETLVTSDSEGLLLVRVLHHSRWTTWKVLR
ncbi:MAG: cyanophycinase [Flavobacteriales bacterium]